MDFGALPPEINSARMYSGPGPGSMLAAANAWDELASELNSSAATYRSVIAGLAVDGWQGPSSIMMSEAVSPYIAWMHSTAAQAEQTAAQARTAASAYQSAFAVTVPPPLIAANRTRLTSLIASNFFGQNSPAIAATEAAYDEMWAQDATTMYGYANSSAAATRFTPFAQPPATTNPAGQGAQAAAVAQAASTPAANQAQTLSQLPTTLQSLAAAPSAGFLDLFDLFTLSGADAIDTGSAAASATSSSFSGASMNVTNNAISIAAQRDAFLGIGPFLGGPLPPLPSALSANIGGPAASAVVGRASLVGTLSVPQTWAATATPAVNPAALALPNPAAAPIPYDAVPQSIFGESLLGTLAGRGVSNVAAKLRTPSVVPKSPSAG